MESVKSCVTESCNPSISDVQARFDDWRRNRCKRGRIPKELWTEAVELARIHGISKVSTALHLNYTRLKKQLESDSLPAKQNHDTSRIGFIELQSMPSDHCVIEFKRPDGNCMQIRLNNVCSASYLTPLVQVFIG